MSYSYYVSESSEEIAICGSCYIDGHVYTLVSTLYMDPETWDFLYQGRIDKWADENTIEYSEVVYSDEWDEYVGAGLQNVNGVPRATTLGYISRKQGVGLCDDYWFSIDISGNIELNIYGGSTTIVGSGADWPDNACVDYYMGETLWLYSTGSSYNIGGCSITLPADSEPTFIVRESSTIFVGYYGDSGQEYVAQFNYSDGTCVCTKEVDTLPDGFLKIRRRGNIIAFAGIYNGSSYSRGYVCFLDTTTGLMTAVGGDMLYSGDMSELDCAITDTKVIGWYSRYPYSIYTKEVEYAQDTPDLSSIGFIQDSSGYTCATPTLSASMYGTSTTDNIHIQLSVYADESCTDLITSVDTINNRDIFKLNGQAFPADGLKGTELNNKITCSVYTGPIHTGYSVWAVGMMK